MSLECSECERDLRGGHWIGCSRYNLVRGVAYAIARAAGHIVDDEYDLDPRTIKCAEAAIAHVRDYDAVRPSLAEQKEAER